MYARIEAFIRKKDLINPGDAVWIGLSGGMDSMALFYTLYELKNQFNFQLKAIHVNHHIRIPDADEDERFVLDVCRKFEIPFIVNHLSGFDLKSSEEQLRIARYNCFNTLLKDNPRSKLATGHHFDDQVETVLMRIARGSSVKGLRGIPARRGPYIRPLLELTRNEIEVFVKENNIPYRKDFTNDIADKTRNRIRLQVIPTLRDIFGAGFYENIHHTITEIESFYDAFYKLGRELYAEKCICRENSCSVSIAEWRKLDLPFRKLILESCVYKISRLNSHFAGSYVKVISDFIDQAQTGSLFKINPKITMYKNRRHIVFRKEQINKKQEFFLEAGGEVKFGRNKLSLLEVQSRDVKFTGNPNVEYICGDRATLPVKVRSWGKGDFFYPLGMSQRQKVSDFFVDHKIDRDEKQQVPIIESGGEIVWLAGLRLDNRFRVGKNCKRIFKLELLKG
ncbi:MAG: tRNA lysidine(34) synthetase TilS [Calditrichaceae bacterium]|nr:tRNA lysidine(34) synthetase TilS [Calditrichaceae bacterium]MBN2709214.1 tRNA lysidine(34) synthetase TilS [Calditrichaceae bacterium]